MQLSTLSLPAVQVSGDSTMVRLGLPRDPGARRSFPAASVAAGGEVTVTITADGYGIFGEVAETLPPGSITYPAIW